MTDASGADELRFAVHALFAMPDLVDPEHGVVSVASQPAQTLRSTYYDSPDLRLARDGITLQHRSGDGAPTWTLQLATSDGSGSGRDEIHSPGPAREVPAELKSLLVAWLRGASLSPVATLRTQRALSILCGEAGEELGEVVDDSVSVLEGRRVLARFREVEVLAVGLPEPGRLEVRRRLVEAGASGADRLPQVVRALGPRAAAPGEVPLPTPVGPSDPAGALVTAAMRTSLRRLLSADVGVRRRHEDAVHQMRVACRRLRSDLKTFRPLVEPLWGESLRAECKWLADSLGDARDLEVLRERLREPVDTERTLPYDRAAFARLDNILAVREQKALSTAADALQSERYLRLLETLVDAAREPVLAPLAQQRCSKVLPPLVRSAWNAMAKRARKLSASDPDDDWHEARIKAKQARYAAEAVVSVLGRPANRLAGAAKAVQEVLGRHQDAAIAAETVAAIAVDVEEDGALCYLAGRLVEWNRGDIGRTRQEFPAVWKKAEKAA